MCTVTAKQNYTPINKIGGRGVNCSHPAGLSVYVSGCVWEIPSELLDPFYQTWHDAASS